MPEITYEILLRRLVRRGLFHIQPGLERVSRILSRLGDPQDRIRSIHIAGTNGKGSVAASLESIMRHAGFHTGLYTSPHLCDLRERIQIDRQPITPDDFVLTAQAVLQAEQATSIRLTYFEFVTVMAFMRFAQEPIDIAIIETGLGGRWDATNVLKRPELSIITSIGRDHMQWLGATEDLIAAEKAGIIKPGRPVVSGVRGGPANVIGRTAKLQQATCLSIDKDFRATGGSIQWEQGLQSLRYQAGLAPFSKFAVHLLGTHQVSNTAVTLAAVGRLVDLGWRVTNRALRRGLLAVEWPGRFQIVQRARQPIIILDGAHNLPGIEQLLETLASSPWSNVPKTFVFSVYKDKEYAKMIVRIAALANQVVVCSLAGKRALKSTQAAALFRSHLDPAAVHRVSGPSQAIQRALTVTPLEGVVIATGSLAFMGSLLTELKAGSQLAASAKLIPTLTTSEDKWLRN